MTRRISYSPAGTFLGGQVSTLVLLQEDIADWAVSGRERRDVLVDVQEGEGEPVMLWAVTVSSRGELSIYDRSYQGDTPDEPLVFALPVQEEDLMDVLIKARKDYFSRPHNR